MFAPLWSPLVSLLFILSCLLTLTTSVQAITGWETIYARVDKSVVPITYRTSGGCTGFVINKEKNYVLTAKHCMPTVLPDTIFVDKIPAEIVAADVQQDLLVLMVKDLDKPALSLADKGPAIWEQVGSLGYGYALIRPLPRIAYVSDNAALIPDITGGPFAVVDAAFVPGQSGAPVVNLAGEVVMIVQMTSDRVGIGVGVEILKDRVGKYWKADSVKP
jgi:S1-C subfamily serine protease